MLFLLCICLLFYSFVLWGDLKSPERRWQIKCIIVNIIIIINRQPSGKEEIQSGVHSLCGAESLGFCFSQRRPVIMWHVISKLWQARQPLCPSERGSL